MQIRSIEIRAIACFVCVVIFLFFLEAALFLSSTFTCSSGIADAASVPSRDQRARSATREGAETPREIELVQTTSQGVIIQLLIPESDFEIEAASDSQEQLQARRVEGLTVSFPGCGFTAQLPGMLRLPIQSTLISVPPDVNFQVRIVEKDFSTRKVQKVISASAFQGASQKTDRFFSNQSRGN